MAWIENCVRDAEATLFERYGAKPDESILHIDVDGTQVRIRVLAFGVGAPVVCLHAASWFAAHWILLCALMPHQRFYCIDMPGHGLSDGVDYRNKELRSFQVGIFKQIVVGLGLSGVPVIGNSLGGMTALWLALDMPELVSQVVILGVPATALPGARPDLLLSLLSIRGLNRLVLGLLSTPATSRLAMRPALGSDAISRIPAEMFRIHSLARRRREFAKTIGSWMPETHRWRRGRANVELSDAELSCLRQPVHFFWGETDVFGGPDMARRAAAMIPSARVQTHPGGHHPQLSDPEACARAVSLFLS